MKTVARACDITPFVGEACLRHADLMQPLDTQLLLRNTGCSLKQDLIRNTGCSLKQDLIRNTGYTSESIQTIEFKTQNGLKSTNVPTQI